MSRSVWIDEGNTPNVPKDNAYGIVRPVFSMKDPQVNLTFLRSWRATTPFDSVCVYAAANWNSAWGTDPSAFAAWLDTTLTKIAPATGMYLPRVLLNVEKAWVANYPGGIPSYMTDLLGAYRVRRPTRATSWVLDAMQGGWWDGRPGDVQAILDAKLEGIYVECFGSAVSSTSGTYLEPIDQDAARQDIVARGFPEGLVGACHDGRKLGDIVNGVRYVRQGWEGLAFTDGRLA